jgi:TPR repeat protein
MYNEELGVRRDPLEASKWFIWAADQGDSNAQYNLGQLKLKGRGLRQDIPEGLNWLFKSAHQRNVQACFNLGLFYVGGEHGLGMDEEICNRLMDFAAKNGHLPAQLCMEYLLGRGGCITENTHNFFNYMSMASNAGNAEAHHILATLYLNGKGVDQDYLKAYELFKQADDHKYYFDESMF